MTHEMRDIKNNKKRMKILIRKIKMVAELKEMDN